MRSNTRSGTTLVAADADYCGEYILPLGPGGRSRMTKPSQAVAEGFAKIGEDGRTHKIPLSERKDQRFASG